MQFASGVSVAQDSSAAVEQAIRRVVTGVRRAPDLIVAFGTSHHESAVASIATRLSATTSMSGVSLGAISSGVVAGSEEFESGAALVVWAAWLDNAGAAAMRLVAFHTDRGIGIGGIDLPDDTKGVLLVADPYSFPAGQFATSLGSIPVAGGIPASLGNETAMFLNGQVFTNGAVAVALSGALEFRATVSQGCEPVGEPATVTRAAGRVIEEIGGVPAMAFVERLIKGLEEIRQEQVRRGLQIGIAIDEYKTDHHRGDFLIRAVTGADRETQAILIGDEVAVGATVQFHVRDPRAAAIDLNDAVGQFGSGGMLMFTSDGRGQGFFGSPHHDAAMVVEACQPVALGGMIGSGEIGPVSDTSYVHAYCAVIVEISEPA